MRTLLGLALMFGFAAQSHAQWWWWRPADRTAPVISNVQAVPAETGASITWTTNESSTSTVQYGLSTSYGYTTTISTRVLNHSVLITSLQSSTLYHYRVQSRDLAGNTATSGDYTFTTLTSAPDPDPEPDPDPDPDPQPTNFLINQNFEGMGFDNGESTLWYYDRGDATGIADPDYSASPIKGAQSLRMRDDGTNGSYAVAKFHNYPGLTKFYGFFRVKFIQFPRAMREFFSTYAIDKWPNPTVYEVEDSIYLYTSGGPVVLQIATPEGNHREGTTQLQLGTEYRVWYMIDRSVSQRSSGWIKLSTNDTMPTVNEVSWSGFPCSRRYATTNVMGFSTMHNTGYEWIADEVIVSKSEIGSR